MGDDKTLEVKITADSQGVKTGVEAGAKSVQDAVSKINGSLSNMHSQTQSKMSSVQNIFTDTFSKIKAAAEQFGAVILSYLSVQGLKSSVEAALNYGESIEKLSKTMGITTEAASDLAIAIKLIGGTTDEYVGMNMKLLMKLKENEASISKLGVVTRDTNGIFLSQDKIFKNAIETMMQYKQGADQDQFALAVFGKSAQEVFKYQNMTNEVMATATEMAKQYGLELSGTTVEATEKASQKVNAMKVVFEALKIKIGQELLPHLLDFGKWLLENGTPLIEGFTTAIKSLATIFYTLKGVVEIVATNWIMSLTGMADTATGAWAAIKKAWSGDFKGAWAELQRTSEKVKTDFINGMLQMKESAEKNMAAIKALWETPAPKRLETATGTAETETKGTEAYISPTKKDEDFAKWTKELEHQKIAQQDFFADSNKMELAFWGQKLKLTTDGTDKWWSVKQKIYELDKAAAQESYATDVSKLRLEQAAEGISAKRKLEIQDLILARTKVSYGEQSREYRQLVMEREKLETEFSKFTIEETQKQLERELKAGEDRLDVAENQNNRLYERGQISASKMLTTQLDIANERYRIEVETYNKIAALWGKYPVEYNETQDKIVVSTKKHDDTIDKTNDTLYKETEKKYSKLLTPVTRAISQSINGMIQGTQTLRQTLQNLFQNILGSFVDMLAQMLETWILNQLTTAATGKAIQTTAATESITTSAAQGSAGAAAAVAPTPFIGPALAVAAAAAMMALIMGFAGQTAAQGYDIPAGINPVVQTHAEEMILPAHLANAVRGMTSGGGRGGTVIIKAMDSKDVARVLKSNNRLVNSAMQMANRNFAVKKR